MSCKMPDYSKNTKEYNDNRFIDVTCAIIEKNGKVLAAQRGSGMQMPYKWEFPGGKINAGETAEDCIIREIKEELGLHIQIKAMLRPSSHAYPDFRIRLHPFVCRITTGNIVLAEHQAVQWTAHGQLLSLEWAEADVAVVKSYIDYLIFQKGHNDEQSQS